MTRSVRGGAGVLRAVLFQLGQKRAACGGRRRFCGIVGEMNPRCGIAAALSLGIALAVVGCGAGSAAKGEGGVSSCQPSASGLGMMSWLDDGTQECAVSALAT